MPSATKAVEDEIERHTRLILAAETWSGLYGKDPKTHGLLIRQNAKLLRIIRSYFKDMADNIDSLIDWHVYSNLLTQQQLKADITVQAIVNDDLLDDQNGLFMTVVFDTIANVTGIGAQAGENIYKIALGLSSTSSIIQELARDQIAALVGKKIDKQGNVIDNPKSEYAINDTTRDDIISSIKTSLNIGESKADAVERLQATIGNLGSRRAEVIANTESVNAYQKGLAEFGSQSGAVGKEWQDVGAVDVCADNTADGPIPIDATFSSGDSEPTAHPNCRCGCRYIYQQEWNEINGGDDNSE